MHALRRSILRHRAPAGWLLAIVLVMKMLVPTGFMPAVHNGAITVQMCTGQGVQTVRMEIPGRMESPDLPGHGDDHGAKKTDMPCAFAGVGAAYADAGAIPPLAFPPYRTVAPSAARPATPGQGLAAPPPPATGPPTLA